MNIGVLTPVVGFQGGIERLSYELALGLRARGHRVVLLDGGRPGNDAKAFRAAFDAPGGGRFDVVLAQKVTDLAAVAHLGHVPLVFGAHDHDHTCPRSHRYLPLSLEPCHRPPGAACVANGCVLVKRGRSLSLVNPWSLRASVQELARHGRMLACSSYIADRLIEAGVAPERVSVAYPCTSWQPRPSAPRPAGARLLFVGQLLRGKGVDVAIQALALMPDAHLTVVGDGPSRGDLEAMAQRLTPGRVRFEGQVAPEAVDRFYDEASVVLVPSRWPEPFGMIGVEAMRRARPVVGAAHGGIPEWLADGIGGFLFEPGDPVSLARAARRALSEPELGEWARIFVEQRFSHQGYLDQVEEALQAASRSGVSASAESETTL